MKTLQLLVKVVLLNVLLFSCNTDEEVVKDRTAEFKGRWTMTLTPKNDIKSSEVIKGEKETDIPSNPIHEKISFFTQEKFDDLFQGNTIDKKPTDLLGFKGLKVLKLSIVDDTSITIKIYQRDSAKHTSGIATSKMMLRKVKEEVYEGEGEILYDLEEEKPTEETYTVRLVKINDSPNLLGRQSDIVFALKQICEGFSDINNEVLAIKANKTKRMRNNCSWKRNGGGYYLFGDATPNKNGAFTNTAYVAAEWSWCKGRKYRFKIKSGGSRRNKGKAYTIKDVVDECLGNRWYDNWFGKYTGLEKPQYSDNQIKRYIEDIYNTVGHFAISLGYSHRTRNLSIYVNVLGDQSKHYNTIKTHPLIQAIAKHIRNKGVYFYMGENIHDPWHLKRTLFPFFLTKDFGCNSVLEFHYLFGTLAVRYD